MTSTIGTSISNPRFRPITADNIISPVGGANPVDGGIPISLQNIRGQLTIQGYAEDNNVIWAFEVEGDYHGNPNEDYVVLNNTFFNCNVTTISNGLFEVTTDVSDAGGRVYRFRFFRFSSFGPTVTQNSVNVLGNNTLFIKMAKSALYR